MKKKTVSRILAVMLSAGLMFAMAGCGGGAKDSADNSGKAEEQTSQAEETKAEETEEAGEGEDNSKSGLHEVYMLKERNAMSGLTSPDMEDRSGIEKALPTEEKDGLKIGLSMGQMGSDFFTAMVDSAQDACDSYGYDLVILNADSNISTQSADVESLITMGVDAIILNPMDVTASAADVQNAVDAGIPVIGVGVDYPSDVPVVTSILANNYFGGWYTGLYAGEYFEGKHLTSAALLGMMGHTIDESRINGMIAGIIYTRAQQNGEPFDSQEDAYLEANEMFNELRDKGSMHSKKWDFDIVAQGEGLWTIEGGLSAAEDIIAGNPDLNLFLSSTDYMGQGAVTAIEGAGLTPGEDIYVACGADGSQPVFKLLESDSILVTGYNSPNLNGAAPIDLLHMIFEEGYDANNLPAASDLPNASISKENWKDYHDPDLMYCKILPFEFKTIDQIRADAGLD